VERSAVSFCSLADSLAPISLATIYGMAEAVPFVPEFVLSREACITRPSGTHGKPGQAEPCFQILPRTHVLG
jgi:hypothetical protein